MSLLNLFLIDNNIPDIINFIKSLNENSKYVIYKNNIDTFDNIESKINKIDTKFQNLIFVFKNEYKPSDFLIEKNMGSNENTSLNFINKLIKKYSITNIDFLACNLLKYEEWNSFFNKIIDENNITIRASNNLTGNLKSGGDWILETTNTDIKNLYFNNNLEYWNYLLDNSLHTGIIDTNNTLYVAGNNTYGQLGFNDLILKDMKNIRTLTNLLNDKIIINAATNNNNIAIITDEAINNVYLCGLNQYGELGLGNTNKYYQYTKININKKVIKVAFGYSHMALITNENINNLYTTGDNSYGQLGIGSDTSLNVTTFQQIILNKKVLDVDCGEYHTGILTNDTDANLYTCGSNEFGQLGIGLLVAKKNTFSICNQFININLTNISCGYNHTAVLSNEKTNNLYTCGFNLYGQLGISSINSYNLFQKVVNLTAKKVIKVSCGENHTGFLTTDNIKNLYLCGSNYYGQLGYVQHNVNIITPANTYSLNKKIIDVYCGSSTTCILTNDLTNNIYLAGSNKYNLLNNVSLYSSNFTFINNIYKDKASVIYHKDNSLFFINNDKVSDLNIKNDTYILGYNNQGNYGLYFEKNIYRNPFLTNNVAQIACGENHTVILTYESLNNIYVCGLNDSGQCGIDYKNVNPKFINNFLDTFVKVNIGKKVTNVSCGKNFTAITTNESINNLYVAGNNSNGQFGQNNFSNSQIFKRLDINNKFVKKISCGDSHMGFITNDISNNLFMSGNNAY